MEGYRRYHRYLLGQLKFTAILMLWMTPIGMLASISDVLFRLGWNLGIGGLTVFTTIFIVGAGLRSSVSFIQRNYIPEK